jgi:trimeric autotransporter adhesin
MEAKLTTNISGGLIGLSLLTGQSLQSLGLSSPPLETAAERAAKALFTTPPTTAPWQLAPSSTPESAQVGMIKSMATIIDPANKTEAGGSDDVESSFIAYKALDRLRMLADTAAQPGTTDGERTSLEAAFAKGLSDLQDFLAQAPGQLVNIVFGGPATSVKGAGIAPTQDIGTSVGKGVTTDHTLPVAGVNGNEVLKVSLASGSNKDVVTVDLSTTPQPPTLDSIAKALNDAIGAIQATDVNGNPVVDSSGNAVPRYKTKFVIDRSTGTYGLTLNSGGAQVSIDQANAADSLVVVDSRTQFDTPGGAQVYRYTEGTNGPALQTIGNVSATDRQATEKAALTAEADATADGTATDSTDSSDSTTPSATIPADLNAQASVTDANGYSYIVGTTSGDLGTHRSDGGDDLFLTKLDSEGQIVWQQTLGVAGEAQGAAVSLAPDGGIVVAGSVTGPFEGSLGGNSDMLVAKFDPSGEKQFATSIPSSGDDFASAVAVGADGSIYVGGKAAAANGGDAYVAKLDGTGKITQQRVIDSGGADSVTGFAIDGSGNLLALTRESGQAQLRSLDGTTLADLGSASLGSADARAVAVADDGSIAVVGATSTAVPGAQTNAIAGGRDGFVTRLDAALGNASTTYVGTADDDQLDSVTFMNGDIYVGGRTNGALNGPAHGLVDGFVGRIDSASGAVKSITQFGGTQAVSDPVHVTTSTGGSTILGALGLHRGALNGEISTSLAAQTGLNAGDTFSFQVDGGAIQKITIADGETLTSLTTKIHLAAGTNLTVTTPKNDDGQSQLELLVAPGHTLGLIAGPDGKDALPKLGLEPTRLQSDAPRAANAPLVTPGGSFGLELSMSLNIGNATDAKTALDAITSALSMTQTAYRSLYWDDSKAAQVNGSVGPGDARQQAQLASYQAALQRLTAGTSSGASLL